MPIVTIRRGGDGSVRFDPSPLALRTGEVAVWRNEDPRAQHQVTLEGKPPTFWFPYPLAPFAHGQPADVTSEILFRNAGTFTYRCALHEGESGTIVVS